MTAFDESVLEGLIEDAVERCRETVMATLKARLEAGRDLEGLHVAHCVLGDRIREQIVTDVGNYLRCNEYQIKSWINEAIQEQIGGHIKSVVYNTIQRCSKHVTATFQAALDATA